MRRLSLLILVLAFSISVFAQETIIDKSEFDKLQSENFQILRNKPHRIVMESVSNSNWGETITKSIMETNGIDRYNLMETTTPTSYTKFENVYINSKKYTKGLNSGWSVENINPPDPDIKPFNNNEINIKEDIYKYLGEKLVDGKRTKAYQRISDIINKKKDDNTESLAKNVSTYYFDESGLIIKSETFIEIIKKTADNKEQKTTSKYSRTIEIDRSIKIEAPQIG